MLSIKDKIAILFCLIIIPIITASIVGWYTNTITGFTISYCMGVGVLGIYFFKQKRKTE